VSEELRALMHRTNSFGATAGQLNRGSIDVHQGEFTHAHVAGGISKINTSDNVFGLYAPSSMKEKGEFHLQCLKARSSAALGKQIMLAYNKESMRLTDPDETETVDRPTSPDELRKAMRSPAPPPQTISLNHLMSQRRKQDGV
jgi:hypothetical protein